MATLIRNSTDKVGVLSNHVVGYTIQEPTSGDVTLTVLLDGILPSVGFETAPDIATLTPSAATFIQALQVA